MNEVTIDVPGDLCSKEACDELARLLQEASSGKASEIVLGFHKVNVVSAYSIRILAAWQQEFSKRNRVLVLAGVDGVVANVLRAIRFEQVIRVRS